MSAEESDREDLLGEAVALVERAEVELEPSRLLVTFGFRRNGAVSFYFGGDPAYHFNTRLELRRAFIEGRLYKAERGRLVSLHRKHTPTETQLVRHELSEVEANVALAALAERLSQLAAALAGGGYRLVGQIPPTGHSVGRLRAWLAQVPLPPTIAALPNTT